MARFAQLVVCLVLAAAAIAQAPEGNPGFQDLRLHSKPKIVVWERTYLIIDGLNSGERTVMLGRRLYDEERRLIQTSHFGNIERRTVIRRSQMKVTSEVSYYDQRGNPVDNGNANFRPLAVGESEEGICPKFNVVRSERISGTVREAEICEDGTTRATKLFEYDQKDRLFRSYREDALGRKWERLFSHDGRNFVTEMIFNADDQTRPKWGYRIEYKDPRYDDKGNLISFIGTSYRSNRPDQISHQFVERIKITYY